MTDLLVPGANAIGVKLGDGWLRGNLGFIVARNTFGDRLGLLLRLEIRYAGGSIQVVTSDENWTAATGPILQSDLYNGEVYDARLEQDGWDRPDLRGDWQPVRLIDPPSAALVAQIAPPVRVVQERTTTLISHSPDGQIVYDFGQNLVGRVRLTVQGEAGDEIVLHHAEVLDQQGELYLDNLRTAKQEVRYILRAETRCQSSSTNPASPSRASATSPSRACAASRTPTADRARHPLGHGAGRRIRMLGTAAQPAAAQHRLGPEGQLPRRAHRLPAARRAPGLDRRCPGLLPAPPASTSTSPPSSPSGSATSPPTSAPTAVCRTSCRTSCMRQGERGAGATAWADAAVIVPWTMYQCYGDTRILEQQFDSMVKWVEYMRRSGDDEYLFNVGFHFGDWLALDHKDGNAKIGLTDTDLIATAFYAYSTTLLAQAAAVLGRAGEAAEYKQLAANIRSTFQREFVTASGRLASNTQTAYVLALAFDLLPEEQRSDAARRLVADIRRRGTQLTTGFVGASYLCPVLARFGYLDVAYDLLMRQEYPSWLYPVTQGATTIWERWDGIRPDGSFQDPEMNSFNHYAYGAIGDWLYRVVAGLDTDPSAPGYRRAIVRPRPGGGLSWAYAAHETMLGEYTAGWSQSEGRMRVAVTVPANGHAEVHLPNMQLAHVYESDIPLTAAPGCHNARQEGDDVVVEIGSGDYRFEHIPA